MSENTQVKRSFEEKLDILQRNLKKRIKHVPEMQTVLKKELSLFENQRQELISRITKYKDDEFVSKILQNNLDYIDTQYEKEIAERKTELDRLQRHMPILHVLVKEIDEMKKYPVTYIAVEWILDLFLERTLDDWVAIEEAEKEESKETSSSVN